jgi:hypothetical protein
MLEKPRPEEEALAEIEVRESVEHRHGHRFRPMSSELVERPHSSPTESAGRWDRPEGRETE